MADNRQTRREQPTAGPGMRGPGPGGPHMHGMKAPKLKNAKGTMLRMLGYLADHKVALVVVLVLAIGTNVLPILGTRMTGSIIDDVLSLKDLRALGVACLELLAIYLVNVIVQQIINYKLIDISQNAVRVLRRDLFVRMQNLPVKFFDRNTHGDLMSRFTNDVDNINNMLSQSLGQLIGNVIAIVGTLIAMLLLSPLMTLVSLLTMPLMLFLTGRIAKVSGRYFSRQQSILGRLNGQVEETLSGQYVVKVFNREEAAKENFRAVNGELQEVAIRANMFSGVMGPIMNMINNLGYAVVATFGAWMVLSGHGITVGMVFSFLLYLRQFGFPINQIAQLATTIQSALAGAERIFEVMDEKTEEPDRPGAPALTLVRGEVRADDVTFSYLPDRPVLKNATFHAKPGQTIALVGPTGAGKTTIVNLLTRFYDVDSGSLSIDGIDLRDIQRDSLRSSLGIVLQDTVLFSETVRENIRFGRLNATDAEVERAAQMANADHFITRLPQGYDTVLTSDGGNLSQGQRQLLSIARAILADPAILILDEATSSVDTRTELHIQQAMLELMRGRTSFVIAHRLSTIRNADQILVIRDGEIVERGTHDELLESKGFYANLYQSQFRTGLAL